jgi:hypothetical protein
MKHEWTKYQADVLLNHNEYPRSELVDLFLKSSASHKDVTAQNDFIINTSSNDDDKFNTYEISYACCPDIVFTLNIWRNMFSVRIKDNDLDHLMTVLRYFKTTLFTDEPAHDTTIFKHNEIKTMILLNHDPLLENVVTKVITYMDLKTRQTTQDWIVIQRDYYYIPNPNGRPGSIMSMIYADQSRYSFETDITNPVSQLNEYITHIHARISPYFRQNCDLLNSFKTQRPKCGVTYKDINEFITKGYKQTSPEQPGELISLAPMNPKAIGIIHPKATYTIPVITDEEYQDNYGMLTYEVWELIMNVCMDFDEYISHDEEYESDLKKYHTTLLHIYQSCKLFRKFIMERFLIKHTNQVDLDKWRAMFYGRDAVLLPLCIKDYTYFGDTSKMSFWNNNRARHIVHRVKYKDAWFNRTNLRVYMLTDLTYLKEFEIKWSDNMFTNTKISATIHHSRGTPYFYMNIFNRKGSHLQISYDMDPLHHTRDVPWAAMEIKFYSVIRDNDRIVGVKTYGHDGDFKCELGAGYNRIKYSLFMKHVKSHPDMEYCLDFLESKWMYISSSGMPYITDLFIQIYQSITEFIPKTIDESYTPTPNLMYVKSDARRNYTKSFMGNVPDLENDVSKEMVVVAPEPEPTPKRERDDNEPKPRRSIRKRRRIEKYV